MESSEPQNVDLCQLASLGAIPGAMANNRRMAKATRSSDIKALAGLRLKAARLALAIPRQEDMAGRLQVSVTAYNNYENGSRLPDVYAMVRLLELAGVGPDWIYGGDLRGIPFDLAVRLRDAAHALGLTDPGAGFSSEMQATCQGGGSRTRSRTQRQMT